MPHLSPLTSNPATNIKANPSTNSESRARRRSIPSPTADCRPPRLSTQCQRPHNSSSTLDLEARIALPQPPLLPAHNYPRRPLTQPGAAPSSIRPLPLPLRAQRRHGAPHFYPPHNPRCALPATEPAHQQQSAHKPYERPQQPQPAQPAQFRLGRLPARQQGARRLRRRDRVCVDGAGAGELERREA
jgi:hypothetical protein